MKCLCGHAMAKSHDYNLEGHDEVWACICSPRCRVLCFTKGDKKVFHVRGSYRFKNCLAIWDETEISNNFCEDVIA